MGILHCLGPLFCLTACATDDFGTAQLEFTCLRTLVHDRGALEHLIECKLLDKLSPCVGGSLELLDERGAVRIVVQDLGKP